jgi:hypothetical protein
MKPCPRFWRISFPPADWTTQNSVFIAEGLVIRDAYYQQ